MIPAEYNWRYFFHFTDVRNLESIIKYGILCTNEKERLGIKHHNIANEGIQGRRAEMDVPCGAGGKVHDYVPFYFSSSNPMLLSVLNKKNQDQQFILYFCLKIEKLETLHGVFTDASANTGLPPRFYDDVQYLTKLDWNLIDKHQWGNYTDTDRHRKMAEVLIPKKVGLNDVDKIVVFNEGIRKSLQKLLASNNISIPIVYDGSVGPQGIYHFYYTKFFFRGREEETLVTGPVLLKRSFDKLLSEIEESRKTSAYQYKFKSIEDAVESIDKDFCAVQELSGIYQLDTDNKVHQSNVSDHTLAVVCKMKDTDFYKASDTHLKSVMLLSAYLHDIGKGPKEKWKDGIQKVYSDHPADAIPMLKRILVEDIDVLSKQDIQRICLMVVYHDLIGDVREKGRNKEELYNVISSEEELQLLVAIYEADAGAINPMWTIPFMCHKKDFIANTLNELTKKDAK